MHRSIITTSRLSLLLISYSIIIHSSPQKSDCHQHNIATYEQSPAVVPIQDFKLSPTPNPPPAAATSDIDMPVVSSCTSCPTPSGAPHGPVIMMWIHSRPHCSQSHHARLICADRNDELSMSQSVMRAWPGAVHSWKPLTSRRQPLCAVSVSISDRNAGRAYVNMTRNPRRLSLS